MSRRVDLSKPRPFQQLHASCTLGSRITLGAASISGQRSSCVKTKAAQALWVPLLFALCLYAANAQNPTADLSGTVNDPSGAPVPNARVSLKNLTTGQSNEV